MSLLTVVQITCKLCGISPIPTAAYTSTDVNVQQIVALSEQVGHELMERYDWRNLKIEAEVIGDGSTTLYALPSDWKRMCPSSTSQTSPLVSLSRPTIPIEGPVNDEVLNARKALPLATVFPVWRLIGGSMEIWPALMNGEIVKFWYFSSAWTINAAGTTRSQGWTADTDLSLIDENTITLGTVYKWKQAKGLDYGEAMRSFELAAIRNSAQEDNVRVVRTSAPRPWPDNYWPGFISNPST